MTIVVNQNMTHAAIKDALKDVKKKSKGLRKHFGKLKRDIDAVTHQKQLRNEWNWLFS